MAIMKRVCVVERDDCMREIRREYRYYDPTENEDDKQSFCDWLRGVLYEISWRYDDLNEAIPDTNVNRFEGWIEDADMKNGCIKSNYQLF